VGATELNQTQAGGGGKQRNLEFCPRWKAVFVLLINNFKAPTLPFIVMSNFDVSPSRWHSLLQVGRRTIRFSLKKIQAEVQQNYLLLIVTVHYVSIDCSSLNYAQRNGRELKLGLRWGHFCCFLCGNHSVESTKSTDSTLIGSYRIWRSSITVRIRSLIRALRNFLFTTLRISLLGPFLQSILVYVYVGKTVLCTSL
jgi:hypothetical protein